MGAGAVKMLKFPLDGPPHTHTLGAQLSQGRGRGGAPLSGPLDSLDELALNNSRIAQLNRALSQGSRGAG